MPKRFSQSMRSLDAPQPWLARLLPALALGVLWLLWMMLARVDVYATTTLARVEVSQTPTQVAALEDGRIVRLHCELGRWVEAGDVLVELDGSLERAELAERQSELKALQVNGHALRRHIAAEEKKLHTRWELGELAQRQAGIDLRRARVEAVNRSELAHIANELQELRLNARVEMMNARADGERARLELSHAKVEFNRLRAMQRFQKDEERARLAQLERELLENEGQQSTSVAAIEAVRARLARRVLAAPMRGKLGRTAGHQVGDVLRAGTEVATIVPPAQVRVVADYSPRDAVGRVATGQYARIRFSGFSFMEFGVVNAKVAHVGNEPQGDTVRVEIALDGTSPSLVPLQHGLPAMVDVLVERAAPWKLVLRTIGSRLVVNGAHEARS